MTFVSAALRDVIDDTVKMPVTKTAS